MKKAGLVSLVSVESVQTFHCFAWAGQTCCPDQGSPSASQHHRGIPNHQNLPEDSAAALSLVSPTSDLPRRPYMAGSGQRHSSLQQPPPVIAPLDRRSVDFRRGAKWLPPSTPVSPGRPRQRGSGEAQTRGGGRGLKGPREQSCSRPVAFPSALQSCTGSTPWRGEPIRLHHAPRRKWSVIYSPLAGSGQEPSPAP